ncbi:MAG: sulfurtransferase complex subunit TusC [Aliiglaciecola sp.]
MNTLAIINRSAPFKGQVGQESVDLVLAAATFGQHVSVFFVDDGVFQLLTQSPDEVEQKHFAKSFGAFEFYDVESIYVCQKSLSQRGLSKIDLIIEPEIVDENRLNQLLSQHNNVLSLS